MRPAQLFNDQPYKLELIDGLAKGGIDEYGNETSREASHQHLQVRITLRTCAAGRMLKHTDQIPSDGFKLMSCRWGLLAGR